MKNTAFTYVYKRWNHLKNNRAFKKYPLKAVFRTFWWAIHCSLGIPATISLPRWNCRFFLPPKFRQAGSTGIFVTREDYDLELGYLENLLSTGQVFIDGGANFGIYTVVAANLVGQSGCVLTFEPGVESFATLKKNVELNDINNVKLFQTGLSDREGKTRFYHIDNAPNSYSLGNDTQHNTSFEEIYTISIDLVVERENLERVDVIKLDVEGAEELVLRGAISVLEKMQPTILFEVSEKATGRLDLSSHGAGDFLKELGYEFFAVRESNELVKLDTPKVGNNIAIHCQKCSVAT